MGRLEKGGPIGLTRKGFRVNLSLLLLPLSLLAQIDKTAFVHPPAEFSPGYFWMWNAKLEPARLKAQLDEMVAHGVRSVCIHPVPKGFSPNFTTTMEPDYLSPEYLKIFADVVDHAAARGMNVWLYDEGGWPSGGACGQVARSDPEERFAPRYLGTGEKGDEPFDVRKRPYGATARAYPSVIEPGATERFVELTHEKLKAAVGRHFGRAIKFTFTDEPRLPNDFYDPYNLRWASDLETQFAARHGYALAPHRRLLFDHKYDSDPAAVRVKIDYHETLAALFADRFLGKIGDWCAANGLKSSGHLDGEDLPGQAVRYGYGSLLGSLRRMQVPGIDVIWRQLYPAGIEAGAQLPFPRYPASVAHQAGSNLVLSESFGIYGDAVTPDTMKWLADYQLVRGVNLFVFGYYPLSSAGQWMGLFEPHGGPTAPYWDFERPYFDYIARTGSLLAQGTSAAETLVSFPDRAFWAGGRDAALAEGLHNQAAAALDKFNCEYEYAEDAALAGATVEAGRLRVGARTYATLVLPTRLHLSDAAAAKIAAFERAGGRVLGFDRLGEVKAACAIAPARLAAHFRVAKRRCGDQAIYLIVNESNWPIGIDIRFDERGEICRADPLTGRFHAVETAADGSFHREFAGYGSALFTVGVTADAPAETAFRPEDKVEETTLASGWTLEKRVTHRVGRTDFEIVRETSGAVPVRLGDWRETLGRDFCGRAAYRVAFDDPGGKARLDLGKVGWTCAVKLNGAALPAKFFGPFAWDVELKAGRNELEVEVASLLASAYSDEIRERIFRDYPPTPSYERRHRTFDRENHEAGLFGPVRILRK